MLTNSSRLLSKALTLSLVGVFFMIAPVTQADELNPATDAPQGLIVRKSTDGKTDVFKTAFASVRDEASAALAVEQFVKDANRVGDIKPMNELDRTTSDQAWYYWYNYGYRNYSYSYYSYGYSYNYYPYYSWNYSNYYYYYYRY